MMETSTVVVRLEPFDLPPSLMDHEKNSLKPPRKTKISKKRKLFSSDTSHPMKKKLFFRQTISPPPSSSSPRGEEKTKNIFSKEFYITKLRVSQDRDGTLQREENYVSQR
jgi:hypothetical protein